MKKNYFSAIAFTILFLLTTNISANNEDKERFISNLISRMTLDEKIGQLYICSGKDAITGPNNEKTSHIEQISQGNVGAMLNVLGIDNIRKFQDAAMKSRLRIPLIFLSHLLSYLLYHIHSFYSTAPPSCELVPS